jgi:regulatory protein
MQPPVLSLKGRALRALASREYTRAEIAIKLKPFEEEPGQLDKILNELQAKDFINDQRAADSLVHRRSSKLGASRVLHELRAKGVDAAMVSQAASQLKATELDRAKEVWRRKFGEPADDAAQRLKQMRFLAGRGFAPEVIRRVVAGSFDDDESC